MIPRLKLKQNGLIIFEMLIIYLLQIITPKYCVFLDDHPINETCSPSCEKGCIISTKKVRIISRNDKI
jgi:hypothetical protein